MEWWVWYLIYGRKLPNSTVPLAEGLSLDVLALEKALADKLFRRRLSVGLGDWEQTHVAVPTWQPVIRSRSALRFRVRSSDEDQALEVATHWLPRVLTSLMTINDLPCHAVLVSVQNSESGQSMYQAEQVVTPLADPQTATGEESEQFVQRLARADQSPTTRRLSEILLDATRMALFSRGHSFARVSAVLTYFKLLEGVVNAVTPRPDPKTKSEEISQAINDLELALHQEPSPKARMKALREANDRISKAQFKSASVRVEAAGTKLRLAPEVRKDAQDFVRFRNTKLGHFTDEEPAGLGSWLDEGRAHRVARTFFMAFLDDPAHSGLGG